MLWNLLSISLLTASLPVVASVPDIEGLDEFGRVAAQALDDVARFDDRFVLDWWRPGEKPNLAGMRCERSQQFHIVAMTVPSSSVGTEMAQLGVGACKAEAAKVRDFAIAAQKQGVEALDKLLAGARPDDRAAVEKLVINRTVALPAGAAGYSFTMVLIGHGVMFMHGAVMHDPAKSVAYIVLADVSQLCGHSSGGKTLVPSAFCPDTGKALLDFLTNLAKRDG